MFRRALSALTALLFLSVLALATATPATALEVVTATDASTQVVAFTLDPAAVVQLVVAFLLPVVVGLVTTRVTSAGRKAWLLAGLTLVTSMLVELGRALDAGTTYDVGVALMAALPAFVVSVATHYGLWKPTGVAHAAQDLGARSGVNRNITFRDNRFVG